MLEIEGYDANISALWSVSVTSTGRVIFSNLPSRTTYPIDGFLLVTDHVGDPCGFSSCNLTVTNNLGSSVTVTLPPPSTERNSLLRRGPHRSAVSIAAGPVPAWTALPG